MAEIACVDLFCGAGGLTRGLLDAGLKVVAGVDVDANCAHPYQQNNEGAKFHQVDVSELTAEVVRGWLGDAKVRVLAGCAPCQPFSTYGLRYTKPSTVDTDDRYKGTNGHDHWPLLYQFARLVMEVEPDVVTMENVPEVVKHQVFRDFVTTLEKLSYKVWCQIVDSSDYGLPQRRRRTVLLASKHGELSLEAPNLEHKRTVRDVLSGLAPLTRGGVDVEDPLHAASGLSDLNHDRIRASKPGGTWRDWPEHLVAPCHTRASGKTYAGVYGRMSWDEPSPTLTTQFFGFGNGRFGHPEQDRALSLREGAILQGFPRNYSFVPDSKPIHFTVLGRLIGNAVPVDLGKAIGVSIMRHVEQLAQNTAHEPETAQGRHGEHPC